MQSLRELQDLNFIYVSFGLVNGERICSYDFNIVPGEGAWCAYSHEVLFEDDLSGNATDLVKVRTIDPRRARILAKTNGACFYCGSVEDNMHLDHMHPESRGGSSADSNMIGACMACNLQKKDRTVEEYRAYLSHRRKAESPVVFFGEQSIEQEQRA